MLNHARYYSLELQLEDVLMVVIRHGIDGLKKRKPTAAHVNEAIKSLAKLQGAWVDRTEILPPGWENRSDEEIEFYAVWGRFPQPDELDETVQ
jgi:hypothetical protein